MLMKTTGKSLAKPGDKGFNGRWTREEHEMFLKALNEYGREWKKVAKKIKTRSSAQIRSHAQKYFQKLAKEKRAGLHGGAEAIHGKHVVLHDGEGIGSGSKRKAKSSVSTTVKKSKRGRPTSPRPNAVGKKDGRKGNGNGRFSPVDKPRASPKPVDFGSMIKKPVVFGGEKDMALDGIIVQSLERKLKALLDERLQISNAKSSKKDRHDDGDLVDTPRISPTNIPSKGDTCRIRDRIKRRDTLVKVDKKIQTLCNTSACSAPCVCRVPNLLFHCQNSRNAASGKRACITLRQQMLGKAQACIKKCVNSKTAQSTKLLEAWLRVKKEVESAIKETTSFKNAESLYLTLSPNARANLSGLNTEELMAVQVLIGSRMGLGPTKMNILPILKPQFGPKDNDEETDSDSETESESESSDSDGSSEDE
jgi:SHAQKYF class myb-like DNA-binding protein